MFVGLNSFKAVVTGGTSGIGLESARLLLQLGADVAICGRNPERLDAARETLQTTVAMTPGQSIGRLIARTCDVLSVNEVQEFVDFVKQEFEGLDILINNAGQGRVSTFASTTDADWQDELELKFFGVIRPTRAFLPLLEASSQAAIVCVNSLLSLQPEPHMVATSAARAGLLSLVHSLAHEFAPKQIRVNSILLGLVDSAQWQRRYQADTDTKLTYEEWLTQLAVRKNIPLRRLGKPEEAARAIVFLASPAASYTTGASLDLSGGLARHVG